MADDSPEEEAKFKQDLLKIKIPTFNQRIEEDDDYDAKDEPAKDKTNDQNEKDDFKMPDKIEANGTLSSLLKQNEDKKESQNEKAHKMKKLDTPLAAMLPSKYAHIDVCELFPEFRHGKVLRFSRLFGPGKLSSLPQIWKNVKNRRKKKQNEETKDKEKSEDESEWKLNFAPTPPPELIEEDDEEKLKSLLELTSLNSRQEKDKSDETSPKVADWRYGPAQLWYDMLGVPENGEGFDYGFKLDNHDDDDDEDSRSAISSLIDPDDAFHMVTQYQWENDIIWNGDEIKAKVLAKLNDKNHAAGWVPSGVHRTASSFTQQTIGAPPVPIVSKLPTVTSSKKGDNKKVELSEVRDETWYSIFPVENEELVYGCWEVSLINKKLFFY